MSLAHPLPHTNPELRGRRFASHIAMEETGLHEWLAPHLHLRPTPGAPVDDVGRGSGKVHPPRKQQQEQQQLCPTRATICTCTSLQDALFCSFMRVRPVAGAPKGLRACVWDGVAPVVLPSAHRVPSVVGVLRQSRLPHHQLHSRTQWAPSCCRPRQGGQARRCLLRSA